jgi:phosphoserine aminotransferase
MASRPVNFSAGPAIIDSTVLEAAAKDVLAVDGLGLSILEISHRSPTFERILEETVAGLTRLLNVPDTHEILFLQGGARGQFAQIPLNLLPKDKRAGYVVTGAWSVGALEEAQRLGRAEAIASSGDCKFNYLPSVDSTHLADDLAYVHTTSNNTIYGTQWQALPDFGEIPHVCDMSSDILSRPLNVDRFGLIYAGAQKNAGPAGVTIVILRKDWMASAPTDIPVIWRYETHAKKSSMYNTPPVFAIHCVGLVVKWLEAMGGLDAMAKRNEEKAQLLYSTIDASDGFYRSSVTDPSHRSRMNVSWRLVSEALEKEFVARSSEAGLSGLKGHRSTGGIRASIYNAMPLDGVARLVDFMGTFKTRHG